MISAWDNEGATFNLPTTPQRVFKSTQETFNNGKVCVEFEWLGGTDITSGFISNGYIIMVYQRSSWATDTLRFNTGLSNPQKEQDIPNRLQRNTRYMVCLSIIDKLFTLVKGNEINQMDFDMPEGRNWSHTIFCGTAPNSASGKVIYRHQNFINKMPEGYHDIFYQENHEVTDDVHYSNRMLIFEFVFIPELYS